MRPRKKTYKYISGLTLILFLSSIMLPEGLHASDLADLCNMEMMEHDAMPMAEADHSDQVANHETKHDAAGADTHTGAESCPLDFTCCSIGTTAVKANAVPSPSKIFAGYIPVLVQILDVSPDPEYVKPSEQVFASLYSPPLFLKNSSFLN